MVPFKTISIDVSGSASVKDKLTVVNNISSGKVIYAEGGNSDLWNQSYDTSTTYQTVSAGFALSGYNTTISDAVTSVAVGGASPAPAADWKTKSLVQVFDAILFPDISPTYTIPTIGTTGTTSGNVELGTLISQTITNTAIKNDAGPFTFLGVQRNNSNIQTITDPTSAFQANIVDQFGYLNPNSPNARYTLQFTDQFTVSLGNTTWRSIGNYSNGLPKQNNKGVFDNRAFLVRNTNAPQLGSNSFTSSNITVTGQYRRWVGSVDVLPNNPGDLRNSDLVTSLDTNTNWVASGVPSVFIDKTVIIVLIPNTRQLISVITQANENITNNFALSGVLIPDAGGTLRNYNLYYIENATPLNASLQTVTIANI